METDWRKVLRWLKGFGIFFILIGVFVIVYDTIYSLPDRESGKWLNFLQRGCGKLDSSKTGRKCV